MKIKIRDKEKELEKRRKKKKEYMIGEIFNFQQIKKMFL